MTIDNHFHASCPRPSSSSSIVKVFSHLNCAKCLRTLSFISRMKKSTACNLSFVNYISLSNSHSALWILFLSEEGLLVWSEGLEAEGAREVRDFQKPFSVWMKSSCRNILWVLVSILVQSASRVALSALRRYISSFFARILSKIYLLSFLISLRLVTSSVFSFMRLYISSFFLRIFF